MASRAMRRMRAAAVVLAGGIAAGAGSIAVAAPGLETTALALPASNAFVSGLDLECFDTRGPALNLELQLTHLHPALVQLGLPRHGVVVRELVQTCVAVRKNGVEPPLAVLPFLEQTDLGCYRIDAAPLASPAMVAPQRPGSAPTAPASGVTLTRPAELCLPVARNGATLTPDVLRLVQFIDLECYAGDPGSRPSVGLRVAPIDPELGYISGHQMAVGSSRQRCVPVQSNSLAVPSDVLAIVQWIELEKLAASPAVAVPPVEVALGHLNPLLTTLPHSQVVLRRASALTAPVSGSSATPR